MYTNPYEEELMHRRQLEIDQPQFQQPTPMANLPLYSGPELIPWMSEGNQQQANDSAGALGGGMAALIKRFKKPGTVETPHIGGAVGHAGAGSGIGPAGHGY